MAQQNPSVRPPQVIAPPRPAHATDRYDGPTMLYRLFDADDRLLYIGVTCNPSSRWDGHRADKPWWPLVARKELTTYPDRSAALTAERAAIRDENPLHNVAGNPRIKRTQVHLVLTEDQAAKLRTLAKSMGGASNNDVFLALLDAAPVPASSPTDRVAALHAQCRADYAHAAANRAASAGAARDQLALGRAHAAEGGGHR